MLCSSSRAREEASSTDMLEILSSSMAMCAFLEERASRRAVLVASSAAKRFEASESIGLFSSLLIFTGGEILLDLDML